MIKMREYDNELWSFFRNILSQGGAMQAKASSTEQVNKLDSISSKLTSLSD